MIECEINLKLRIFHSTSTEDGTFHHYFTILQTSYQQKKQIKRHHASASLQKFKKTIDVGISDMNIIMLAEKMWLI